MASWRDPKRFLVPSDRLRELRHTWHRVVVLAAITGLVTGLAIVGFESLTVDVILDGVHELPDAVIVVIPAIGLTLAWLALRWIGLGASPSLADEYLREYHERPGRSDLRAFVGRVVASVATLGSGGAMGFEGPSIYIGASVGGQLQQRYRRFFTRSDTHVLLVAGAAAGVAAIFKAPATGAVFALEVPYQEDAAAHAALPALIGSASSYLVYILFKGTDPLLHVIGNPGFDARDLLGALGLGVVCGLAARVFSVQVKKVKRFQQRSPAWRRIAVGGGGLFVVAVVTLLVFDAPLSIGPGYQAIAWSLAPDRTTALIALLFLLEAIATLFTVAGGGAGGLFIPLVVQGWLVGRVLESVTKTGTSLFPVVGAAAYLGAGYRTPIAAVVFVTEATRGPGFIVPALLATAVSQLLMGGSSVASYQIPRRVGALERRLLQTVTSVMSEPQIMCTSETTLRTLQPTLAADVDDTALVVDSGAFIGTVRTRDLLAVAPGRWETTRAGDVAHRDTPVARPDLTLQEARDVLADPDFDALVVLDADDAPVGIVTARGIAEHLARDEET